MKIRDLSLSDLSNRFRRGRILFQLGPLIVRAEAKNQRFVAAFHGLYSDFQLIDPAEQVADLTLQLRAEGLGSYLWLANGIPAGQEPGKPELVLAMFEWALHWALPRALAPSIAFHGAVIGTKQGGAAAMIGVSGSGKSTLAAGFAARGYELLADEYLILDTENQLVPMPGPITLKLDSIELIRARGAQLTFGPLAIHPRGPILHVTGPHLAHSPGRHQLRSLIFPTYARGERLSFEPSDPPMTFRLLVEQSHNRHILGREGFHQLAALARMPSWIMRFSDLDEGLEAVASTLEPGS